MFPIANQQSKQSPINNQQSTIQMVTITVCVGSSCHIKGSRDVIMGFNELLKEYHLENKVELKGSFCMERCAEGLNWQIDDASISSDSVEHALKTFRERVIDPMKSGT
jgi:NADH:ubiquinone oxidoreductase subunit E